MHLRLGRGDLRCRGRLEQVSRSSTQSLASTAETQPSPPAARHLVSACAYALVRVHTRGIRAQARTDTHVHSIYLHGVLARCVGTIIGAVLAGLAIVGLTLVALLFTWTRRPHQHTRVRGHEPDPSYGMELQPTPAVAMPLVEAVLTTTTERAAAALPPDADPFPSTVPVVRHMSLNASPTVSLEDAEDDEQMKI